MCLWQYKKVLLRFSYISELREKIHSHASSWKKQIQEFPSGMKTSHLMIYFHQYSKTINERVTTDFHEYSPWVILVKSQQIKCSSVISSPASSPPSHFPTLLSSQLSGCCHSWLPKCFLITDLPKRWFTLGAG